MTARAEVIAALSAMCARCDGPMVVTKDAIGRDRLRCPKCDGVAQPRRHPDEVLLPQGLVRANALPPIGPGQLRCQGCARGVPRNARFCPSCAEDEDRRKARAGVRRGGTRVDGAGAAIAYREKPCAKCGTPFAPTGPNARYCEACR